MPRFILDETLAKASHSIGKMRICEARLVDDARWPWIMLIPEKPDCEDLHDLKVPDLTLAMADMRDVAVCLQKLVPCQKINVGSLGNIVRQLHIHVIARNEGDPNWPGPVWGFEKTVPYDDTSREALIAKITKELI